MEEVLLGMNESNSLIESIIKENLDERRLIFNRAIDDSEMEQTILYILKWNKEDKYVPREKRKKIFLYIDSGGGDVITGSNILDVIMQSETPIVGVVFSLAASMASYIISACHERIAFSNSTILFHDGSLGVIQTARKAKDTTEYYEKLNKKLDDVLLKLTNIDEAFLEKIADREYYIFADEAKELGVIDKIIGVDVPMDYIL